MQPPCLAHMAVPLLLVAVVSFPRFVAAQNSAPVVTNVVATQVSGTGVVRVTYDVSDADGDAVTARLLCSSDNGATYDLMPVSVSGDVNTTMLPGAGKIITWNAAADYPGRYWSQVVAKVLVTDGPTLSGEMVFVPAGSFNMGDNSLGGDTSPEHTVNLNGFYIDKYEVSNAEFQRFIDAGGYTTPAFWSVDGWNWLAGDGRTQPIFWGASQYHGGASYPGFPVGGVSYYEAEAYARFAGKRLPTEAEWEKAARGTDGRLFSWGGAALDPSRGNYALSGDPYETYSTPNGFYNGQRDLNSGFQTQDSPGPYGTYDQTGNMWEWVHDWYSANYYGGSPGSNPSGPTTGSSRILRGGSYIDASGNNYLRCAFRYSLPPSWSWSYWYGPVFGFRCAKDSQ